MRRKGVLVSLQPSAWILLLSHFVYAWGALPTHNVGI